MEVKQLPVPEYSDAQWLLIEALGALLPLALAQLELVFRRRNVVDFTQLLLAANQALGDPQAPTELALALDYRIRHLLVDEFQDTSLSQYQLVVRLTALAIKGWRTLFAGRPDAVDLSLREARLGCSAGSKRASVAFGLSRLPS